MPSTPLVPPALPSLVVQLNFCGRTTLKKTNKSFFKRADTENITCLKKKNHEDFQTGSYFCGRRSRQIFFPFFFTQIRSSRSMVIKAKKEKKFVTAFPHLSFQPSFFRPSECFLSTLQNLRVKGVSSKPSGKMIVVPNFCFLSQRLQILATCLFLNFL